MDRRIIILVPARQGPEGVGMAIAMNGMDKCITVAMVGKVLDDDEILNQSKTERRHLGLSLKRQPV